MSRARRALHRDDLFLTKCINKTIELTNRVFDRLWEQSWIPSLSRMLGHVMVAGDADLGPILNTQAAYYKMCRTLVFR